MEAWTNWCEGFLGGILWIIYRHTEDAWSQEQAEHYSLLIEHRKTDRNVHDLGFLFLPTWKAWYDLTGDSAKNQVAIEAGKTWAIYGFTTAYQFTQDARFLDTAQRCADFYIERTPAHGVPP